MTFLTGAARRGAPPKRAYVAIALVVAAFLLGGGSRPDIVSLLLLRPLSAIVLVYALWKYGPLFWQGRWLPGLVLAIVLLPLVHLIPLPPAIWSELPGRGVIVDTFRATGMALPRQPISMTPIATLNALLSLMLPVAMLLLCFSLAKAQQASLLRAVLVVGMVSGLLGLLQAIGSPTSPLYFFRITNNGMAVGLFANRNHQAIFLACMLPLLAAHLSLINARQETVLFQKTVTIAAAVFLIPLILVTGSRNGLLLTGLAIPAAFWIYKAPLAVGRRVEMSSVRKLSFSAYVTIGAAMVALLVFASLRAPAFDRLFSDDVSSDLRWTSFSTLMHAAGEMFPFGSGIGSFVEVYKVYEPYNLLSPSYFNHAHNDYMEIWVTGGLPAVLILLIAAILLLSALRLAVRPDQRMSSSRDDLILLRTGVSVLTLLAIASVGEYPLRTPSLAVFASVAVGWIVSVYRRVYGQKSGHDGEY
jgi:O-antigen ligase